MQTHTFRITSPEGKKTATINDLRKIYSVSNTRGYPTIAHSEITPDLADYIKRGILTDDCAWHGRQTRKVRGAKKSCPMQSQIERTSATRLAAIIPLVPGRLYRQAQSSWAGGKTSWCFVLSGTPKAWGNSDRVWSNNGKWSGNNARLGIHLSYFWLRDVASVPGLRDAGGMLTTHAKLISSNCWQASWVRQGRGFDLIAESGFIIQAEDNTWVHAKTEKAARQLAAKRTVPYLAKLAAKNSEHASRAAYLRTLSAEDIINLYPDVPVRVGDSIAAGNCASGTKNWVAIHFPGQISAPVAKVLAAGNEQAEYVLRAVRAALLRANVQPMQQAA